jgi:hypothetical protein
MKLKVILFTMTALIILAGLLLSAGGCNLSAGEGFAIYLTKEDIPPARMETVSQADLADTPFISIKDIVTYNSQTHELKLTAEAFERIAKLPVPVQGKSFVVCVDKQPVYRGAFWTPISSIGFNGITIWKPYGTGMPPIVTFETGYPSSSFYGGQDPRNSPQILKSLEKSGKLISGLTIASIDKLPRSMKGYELYSWLENGQWRFTLITGTNRNKTLDEIVSKDDLISESGWVKVSVTGTDALKVVLSKIQPGDFVGWLGGLRDPASPSGITLQLPPADIRDIVKEYARLYQLDLNVAAP